MKISVGGFSGGLKEGLLYAQGVIRVRSGLAQGTLRGCSGDQHSVRPTFIVDLTPRHAQSNTCHASAAKFLHSSKSITSVLGRNEWLPLAF